MQRKKVKFIAHTEKPNSHRVSCTKMPGKQEYLTIDFKVELEVIRGAFIKNL